MANVEIKVPDIGDFDEVAVIELLVKVGDTIKAEQSLITVESDKASMEIPSSQGGVVQEIKVKLGDKVKEGSVVVLLEAAAAAGSSVPNTAPAPAVAATCCASSSCFCSTCGGVPRLPVSAVAPIWSATCWCWAVALAATRPPSAPPTSDSRSSSSSATPPWAACA